MPAALRVTWAMQLYATGPEDEKAPPLRSKEAPMRMRRFLYLLLLVATFSCCAVISSVQAQSQPEHLRRAVGVPDKVIRGILRHANVSTTQGSYIKAMDEDVEEAMNR